MGITLLFDYCFFWTIKLRRLPRSTTDRLRRRGERSTLDVTQTGLVQHGNVSSDDLGAQMQASQPICLRPTMTSVCVCRLMPQETNRSVKDFVFADHKIKKECM